METRQGKIEAKTLLFARNKAPYATFTIAGLKYNSFDKEIVDNHNPDDFVEITGEQEGKFWALKTMKKIDEPIEGMVEEAMLKVGKTNGKEYHLSPEEVKCRALECAVAVRIKAFELNKIPFGVEDTLDLADKFVEWIRDGN